MILLSLGTWQVFRLQTKTAQIAAIEKQISSEPVTLSQASSDFQKVRVAGEYLGGADLKKLTSHDGGPGFTVITPLKTSDNTVILVDRGTMSETTQATTPAGPQTLTGILRLHDKGQGLFDPENDPDGGHWYWWDIPAMQAAAKAPANAKVSTFILQLLPDPAIVTPPFPTVPKAELRNNHLGYAITWYGLAAALAAVTWAFLRKRKQLEEQGIKG